jgi:replicative DNA helicase
MKSLTKPTPSENAQVTANVAANLGKLPPQNLDCEEVLLGTVIYYHGAYEKIAELMIPDIFYKEVHQIICAAIIKLKANGYDIDFITLINQLSKDGELESVGGDYYIVGLVNRAGMDLHIDSHVRILWEKFMQREQIRVYSEGIRDAFNGEEDCFSMLTRAKKVLEELELKATSGKSCDFKTTAREVIQEIVNLSDDGRISGMPSYIPKFDEATHGFRKSELTIIAARPGMGKSAWIIQLMINQSIRHDKRVLFFSLEMSKSQIVKRIFSNLTTTNSNKYNSGKLDQADKSSMTYELEQIENSYLFIDDTAGIKIEELSARVNKFKAENDIEIVYVDYLQLIDLSDVNKRNKNREQEISTISRTLKKIAKEVNLPVVALSQLSRKVEERPSKRPQLSDLRESGAIEQDADNVIFMYRPEYYKADKEATEPTDGQCFFDIAKQREGDLCSVVLDYEPQFHIFERNKYAEPTPPTRDYSQPMEPNEDAKF